MDLSESKRIMIIGSAGSGKTTFAKKLHNKLSLPLIHLDKLFWKDNWIQTPRDEWIEVQTKIIEAEEWIIDGNYGGTMDLRAEKADTIIFLDIKRWICLYSVIKRCLTHIGKVRPDMGSGCKEKIDFEFLKWIYNFPKRSRPDIIKMIEYQKGKNIIILKTRKEIKKFLEVA
ncbi:MAG: topology modulation protein [Clostridiales bacterium GWF2_38_85]|nr:MAG: topology modulation protein [Clostridiales bacterium GWF2_38_85]HBL84912.1 topology modulation protein [Clostridiales bacterium]